MFASPHTRRDCHDRLILRRARALALAAFVILAAAGAPLAAAQHEPAAAGAPPAAEQHEPAEAGEAEHGQTLLQSVAKVVNFAVLAGVLVYFLKAPASAYLASRATQIRQDLVTAAETRATATAQLAEIERKLQALPAELEALKAQGAEDVKAEQARIAQAAAAERERLIAQTRREIEARLRLARRQLTEHAAQLAVKIAEDRIRKTITPEDQLRLVDRYAAQLKVAR